MVVAIILVLQFMDPNQPFVLEIHASGHVVGAILLQGGCPIAFESKKLENAQHNSP